MPAACLKGEISEKEKQTKIKSALMWHPGPRRTSEGEGNEAFLLFQCLAYQTSL